MGTYLKRTFMQISKSWQELAPLPREPLSEYLPRIRLKNKYAHIIDEVFAQWIHHLHDDQQTLKNYAWLDFRYVTLETAIWDIEQLLNLNIIPIYEQMRKGYDDPFSRLPQSEEPYWRENGTWRVPPRF